MTAAMLAVCALAFLTHEALSLTSAGSVRVPFGVSVSDKEQGALYMAASLLWLIASLAALAAFGMYGFAVSVVQLLRLLANVRFRPKFAKPTLAAFAAILKQSPRRWIALALLAGTDNLLLFFAGVVLCCAALRTDKKIWVALLSMACVAVFAGMGVWTSVLLALAMTVCCFGSLPLAPLLIMAVAGPCAFLHAPFAWASVLVLVCACVLMRKEIYAAWLPVRAKLLKRRLNGEK